MNTTTMVTEMNAFETTIRHYQETLRQNWDGEGAEAPNETAANLATTWIVQALQRNIKIRSIEPATENGIFILAEENGQRIQAEFLNTGEQLIYLL